MYIQKLDGGSAYFRCFTYSCLYLPQITRGNGPISLSHMFKPGGEKNHQLMFGAMCFFEFDSILWEF